ncbi:MAG TPA: aldo/keto reductase [Pseudonocardiaceae bacterium]|nr:aldo/keto reductase [Pseudonocardiaceae bacterium]
MRYTTFGRTSGLRVSEYARRMFDRFAEAGGTFVDTANSYQFRQSEELLGEFLAADRDRFVVATKFSGSTDRRATVNTTGNNRRNMIATVEASPRRLRTDRIDLLRVHHPDTVTPMKEILRGLDDLTRAGKIRHAGLSNFPRGGCPVARPSPNRVVGHRSRRCSSNTAWSSRPTDREVPRRCRRQAGPAEVAVAWLREQSARSTTPLLPIIGPRSVDQLDSYLAAPGRPAQPGPVRRAGRRQRAVDGCAARGRPVDAGGHAGR